MLQQALTALENASFASPANERHLTALCLPPVLAAQAQAGATAAEGQQRPAFIAWLLRLVTALTTQPPSGSKSQADAASWSKPASGSSSQAGRLQAGAVPGRSSGGSRRRHVADAENTRPQSQGSLCQPPGCDAAGSEQSALPDKGSLRGQALHSALSVLMNVTHDNPGGCKQVGSLRWW